MYRTEQFIYWLYDALVQPRHKVSFKTQAKIKYVCEHNYFWTLWVSKHSLFPCLQLFYQLKGDMCLKVIENGKHKDVLIKEGEVNFHTFYLSNCIPVLKWLQFTCHFVIAIKTKLLLISKPMIPLFFVVLLLLHCLYKSKSGLLQWFNWKYIGLIFC